MSDAQPAKMGKTTAEHVLENLREGKLAQLRERKAKIQTEYMIARRLIQQTYAEFSADDLPVDLQRLIRDLEIHRDQRVSDAREEIDQAYATAQVVLMSVADSHPALYKIEPKIRSAGKEPTPADTPAKIAKHLSAQDMHRIASAVAGEPEGISLVVLCERLQLTTPPAHMAAKRFLGWLRSSGHVKTQGPGGKGLRYASTKTLRKLIAKLVPTEQ